MSGASAAFAYLPPASWKRPESNARLASVSSLLGSCARPESRRGGETRQPTARSRAFLPGRGRGRREGFLFTVRHGHLARVRIDAFARERDAMRAGGDWKTL